MIMFNTTYCCAQLFSKMKHAKIMLRSQLSNHHLSDVLLISSSFNPDTTSIFIITNNIRSLIDKLWLLPNEFVYFFRPF